MSCPGLLSVYVALATPIAGLFSATLWYLDSKEIEFPYMPELRYGSALLSGIPGLALAFCTIGLI
jgi:hypothetical protein